MAVARGVADLLAAFDRPALIGALKAGGAPAAAVRLAGGTGRYRPPDRATAEALLVALLDQAVDPVVSVPRLDAFRAAAARFGWEEAERVGLVAQRLGVTEARVRAHGLLGLSLAATRREIKTAHRRAAKRLHPDRLVRSAATHRAQAERQLARLNAARDLLLRDEGVVLAGGDDVTLEAPHFDPEDAPTVVWGDPAVAEDAETVVLDDLSLDPELLWR